MSDFVPDPAGTAEKQRTLLVEITGNMTGAVAHGLLEEIRHEARRVGAQADLIWPTRNATPAAGKKSVKKKMTAVKRR